jgi:hypothetical protein
VVVVETLELMVVMEASGTQRFLILQLAPLMRVGKVDGKRVPVAREELQFH